jgi:hypothetical protein
MGVVALKTQAGKVLRNKIGKVVKQNYKFGKCVKLNGARGPYLSTNTNLGLSPNNFTIMYFCDRDLTTDSYMPLLEFTTDEGTGKLYCMLGINGLNMSKAELDNTAVVDQLTNLGSPTALPNTNGRKFIAIRLSNEVTNNFTFQTNSTVKYQTSYNFTGNLVKLHIGFVTQGAAFSQGQNITVIFDRVVSDAEVTYFCNNLSGSDVQSFVGLKALYTMQAAEILDFSVAQDGSDMRVGVRDQSGNNNHLFYTNISAGTLATQLSAVSVFHESNFI